MRPNLRPQTRPDPSRLNRQPTPALRLRLSRLCHANLAYADLSHARLWITTEKDALKILPRWTHGADVRVLASGIEVEQDEAFVDWLERTLRAKRR